MTLVPEDVGTPVGLFGIEPNGDPVHPTEAPLVIIGVPKERLVDEYRVAITPAGVRELTAAGHQVVVEQGRGDRVLHPRRGLRPDRGQDPARAPTRCGPRPTSCSR